MQFFRTVVYYLIRISSATQLIHLKREGLNDLLRVCVEEMLQFSGY